MPCSYPAALAATSRRLATATSRTKLFLPSRSLGVKASLPASSSSAAAAQVDLVNDTDASTNTAPHFPRMFEPLALGPDIGTLPNRVLMGSMHTGRYAIHPFAVSASATKSPISPFPAKELSPSGVQSTIADFVRCAALAKRAGYDGVEIMGSEGYLINQFLVRKTNHRTDDYGGPDFANRMRFAVDIVRETRAAVGRDFIIIFRLSMLDLVEDGSSWEEVKLLAQAIEDAGATIINTGIGWHEARVRKFLYSFIDSMVHVCDVYNMYDS